MAARSRTGLARLLTTRRASATPQFRANSATGSPDALPPTCAAAQGGRAAAGQRRPRISNHCGSGATHGLGEADADPHRGASVASRLLDAAATPLIAVATPVTVLALGWALRLEIAILSV